MTIESLYSAIEPGLLVEIEEAAFAAWPAAEVLGLEGWRLRASGGVTNRANSVWSLAGESEMPLADRVDYVERFYRARGLQPCFQMTAGAQPRELDDALAARGYELYSPTLVQRASIVEMLRGAPALQSLPHIAIEVSEAFDEGWFELYETNEGEDPAMAQGRAEILKRIAAPCAFVRADVDGVAAAVALGVVSGKQLGVFCVSTAASACRRHAASGMMRALAIWAQMVGAEQAYLQVKSTNAAAIALYEGMGFRTAYNYHYRILRSGETH